MTENGFILGLDVRLTNGTDVVTNHPQPKVGNTLKNLKEKCLKQKKVKLSLG